MKKTIITIGILLTILLIGGPAVTAHPHPEETESSDFTIHPSYMHGDNTHWIIRNAEQGSKITDFVTIENLSSQKHTFNLEIKGAEEQESSFVINDADLQNDLIKWSSLPESTVTLEPYESKKISFELTIPEAADIKNYTGAILASRKYANPNTINIVKRIGVRMFINITEPQPIQANIFSSRAYVNTMFFFLSLFGVMASIFYTLINYLDQRKYEKKHA